MQKTKYAKQENNEPTQITSKRKHYQSLNEANIKDNNQKTLLISKTRTKYQQ